MKNITRGKIILEGGERFLVQYITKSFLGFTWDVLVKSDSLGKEINIISDHFINVVRLNGKVLR